MRAGDAGINGTCMSWDLNEPKRMPFIGRNWDKVTRSRNVIFAFSMQVGLLKTPVAINMLYILVQETVCYLFNIILLTTCLAGKLNI